MRRMKKLTIGLSTLLVVACAHSPAPAARTAQVQSTPPATKASAVPVSNADGTKPAVNTDLVKQGYRTSLRNGQLLYCRTAALTGTRFKSQVCQTEQQILDEQKHARDTMNSQQSNFCAGPDCSK